MDHKIQAFGACMIGGFPHGYDHSCFHLAVEQLRAKTKDNVITSIFTLGGFPVTRVIKHLPTKCLASQPDIVVLQFGASDLIVPLRHPNHRSNGASVHRQVKSRIANLSDRIQWHLRGTLNEFLKGTSVTTPELYLQTMDHIIRSVADHDAVPVVLSPFVFGDHYSDRIARDCVPRLQRITLDVPRARFVDVYSVLNRHPRHRMLLCDGTHLSLEGQAVVGECLSHSLTHILQDQSAEASRRPIDPLI